MRLPPEPYLPRRDCLACRHLWFSLGTDSGPSWEHPISGAFGGRLQGRNICKRCNSAFGHRVDDLLRLDLGRDHWSPGRRAATAAHRVEPYERVDRRAAERAARMSDGYVEHDVGPLYFRPGVGVVKYSLQHYVDGVWMHTRQGALTSI